LKDYEGVKDEIKYSEPGMEALGCDPDRAEMKKSERSPGKCASIY
jgi:hypothetical protein